MKKLLVGLATKAWKPAALAALLAGLVLSLSAGPAVPQAEAISIPAGRPTVRLPYPVGNTWTVTCGYECHQRNTGGDRFNLYAVDFKATPSTDRTVYAPVSGRVVGTGCWVRIDAGNGWIAALGHLASSSVTVGQTVSFGQPVGVMGSCDADNVHLHMALWHRDSDGVTRSYPFGSISCYLDSDFKYETPTNTKQVQALNCPNAQQLSDTTGDGKADAVIYFQNDGAWYVSPSTGSSFAPFGKWMQGHGVGSNRQFLADVNGDRRTDAVVYFSGDGSWYVSLSTGSSYAPYSKWTQGHGVGSNNQFLRDVTGDGKADAVVYFGGDGSWYVASSTGSSFAPYSRWIQGHGVGSKDQLMADTTGDGKADAIVYFHHDGSWYVAPSTGSSFAPYSRWIQGHGVGSNRRVVADVTGDRKVDAVVYFGGDGAWYVAPSTGSGFAPYSRWIQGHGVGSANQLLADVTGDGRADAVVYFGADGTWYVSPSTGSAFAPFTRWIQGHGIGS